MQRWMILLFVLVVAIVAVLLERHNRKVEASAPSYIRLSLHTTIGELLAYDPKIADVLKEHGLHCANCPSAAGETLEQAAQVHGLNAIDLLVSVGAYLEQKAIEQA